MQQSDLATHQTLATLHLVLLFHLFLIAISLGQITMDGLEVEEVLSDVDLKEKEFHGMVREVVILCLISISLYIGSFAFLGLVRRERDEVSCN